MRLSPHSVPTAQITLEANEDEVEERKGEQTSGTLVTERNQIEELLMAELESLFDRPNIVQPTDHSPSVASSAAKPASGPQQQRLRLVFEPDAENSFLVTNPAAIYQTLKPERFFELTADLQLLLIERVNEILSKCPHNAYQISDQLASLNVARVNQDCIAHYRRQTQESIFARYLDKTRERKEIPSRKLKSWGQNQDIVFLLIYLGLKVEGTTDDSVNYTALRVAETVRKICQGHRYLRCHVELIFQYARVVVTKMHGKWNAAVLDLKQTTAEHLQANWLTPFEAIVQKAYTKLLYSMRLLKSMVEQHRDIGPQNYFYFSGYMSGILLNSKQHATQHWPFGKGFAVNVWFCLLEQGVGAFQDPENLPVLFNCFSMGHGGFECYLNGMKLCYRILPKQYSSPTVHSNGVTIGEFIPGKWYFLALEHDAPYLARAQLTAVINDKQVVNFSMDYPKFEKNAKLSVASVCKNFVGQLSSFVLFREPVNNTQKFVQMQKVYEYGVGSRSRSLNALDQDIFDQKMLDKLLLIYSPQRTQTKVVFDCVDMNDGELLINSGVVHSAGKECISRTGGLTSLLPLMEAITAVTQKRLQIALQTSEDPDSDSPAQTPEKEGVAAQEQTRSKSANLINEFLRLTIAIVSAAENQTDTSYAELNQFFKVMFDLISRLPVASMTLSQNAELSKGGGNASSSNRAPHFSQHLIDAQAVDCQTIQLLAELRFLIADQQLCQCFFVNLVQTSDFWVNTHNVEVMREFWSFVKAIYSQNPLVYNQLFPISNLTDLMLKISESQTSFQQACCAYHHSTQLIHVLDTNGAGNQSDINTLALQTQAADQDKISYGRTDEYLEPIAGVLENVLTSGAVPEILEQVETLVKCLTARSSSCFYLQILKLLKVLLLDSAEEGRRDQNSSQSLQNISQNDSQALFAQHFLSAKGMQILLHLSAYTTAFDVKALCVKLINDLVSQYTSLITLRIDTDLVTYLSNAILPDKLLRQQLLSQHRVLTKTKQRALSKRQENKEEETELINEGDEAVQAEKHEEVKYFSYNEQEQEDDDLLSDDYKHDSNEDETPAADSEEEGIELRRSAMPPAPKQSSRGGKTMFSFKDLEGDEASNSDEGSGSKKSEKSDEKSVKSDQEEEKESKDNKNTEKETDAETSQFQRTTRTPLTFENDGQTSSTKTFGSRSGLNIDLSHEESTFKAPPNTKTSFQQKRNVPGGPRGAPGGITFNEESGEDDSETDDSKPPKPTQELLMSRNLRAGGQKKGFNFKFEGASDSGDSVSSAEVAKDVSPQEQSRMDDNCSPMLQLEDDGGLQLPKNRFARDKPQMKVETSSKPTSGQRHFNLLHKKLDLASDRSKSDASQEQQPPPPKRRVQINNLFTAQMAEHDGESSASENSMSPIDGGRKREALKEDEESKSTIVGMGTTGATHDQVSAEQPPVDDDSPKLMAPPPRSKKRTIVGKQTSAKAGGSSLMARKRPNFPMLNTDEINSQFQFGAMTTQGGEHIELVEVEAIKRLERDIEDLANDCVSSMHRYYRKLEREQLGNNLNESQETSADARLPYRNMDYDTKDMFNVPQPIKGIRKTIDMSIEQPEEDEEAISQQIFSPLYEAEDDEAVDITKKKTVKLEELQEAELPKPKKANLMLITEIEDQEKKILDAPQKGDASPPKPPKLQGKTVSQGQLINRGLIIGDEDSEFDEDKRDSVERFLLDNTSKTKVSPKEVADNAMGSETQENLKLMDEINELPIATASLQQSNSLGNTYANGLLNANELNQELENLYTSCLEWTLKRRPVALSKTIMIDDYDHITFQPAMQMLMTVVAYSSNLVRQRALQDMFMLAQLNNANGQILLQHPHFHTWLLQLLMPYQDLVMTQATEQMLNDSSRAVYDMGCKLHTLLLKSVCGNTEEFVGYKKVNLLTRWPTIVAYQIVQQGTGTDTANYLYREWDVETAHALSRVLLTNLICSLKDETHPMQPPEQLSEVMQSSVWRNIVHITLQVEELILSSHSKNSSLTEKTGQKSVGDVNESLLRWLQRDFLLVWDDTNWAEWDLVEAILKVVEKIFPESMFAYQADQAGSPIELEQKLFLDLLQSKDQEDNYQGVIEVLMQELAPNQAPPQNNSSFSNRFSIFSGSQQGTPSNATAQAQQLCESNFMKALINILCLTVGQTTLKEDSAKWLDRLERFIKFLLVISANWSTKNQANYALVQRKIADAVAFTLTFLFHEVHQPETPTGVGSNVTELTTQKQFAKSLKRLFVFIVNVVHYADLFRKKRSGTTAAKIVLQTILVKNYGSSEQLISEADVQRLKESNFDELPECFYQSDWKVTFFHNASLSSIVNSQISILLLTGFQARRQQYAQHVLELQSKAEKAKQQILERMQADTVDAISAISEAEHERKAKQSYLIDASVRERQAAHRQNQKLIRGPKGIWREEHSKYLSQTVSKYAASDGSKCFLKDRPSNGFMLLGASTDDNDMSEMREDLESRLVHKVVRLQCDLTYAAQDNDLKRLAAVCAHLKPDNRVKNQDSEEISDTDEYKEEEKKIGQVRPDLGVERRGDDVELTEVRHFSHRLTSRQKQDLQAYHTKYMQEFIFLQQGSHFSSSQNKAPSKRKMIIEGRCDILTQMLKKPATLIVTNIELIFVYDLGEPKTNADNININVMMFPWSIPNDRLLYKVVPLSHIKEIQRRRFLGQKTALEFFMVENANMLLNFDSYDQRNEFAKKIIRQRNSKCKNLNYYASLDPKRILKKRGLTEDWMNWRISNFEYLMHLNMLSGRSYNDLSQYPIMPWVITQQDATKAPDLKLVNPVSRGGAPPGEFRDLTKNMQLLGSAERQAEFKRKYEDSDGFVGLDDRFHCGSHYSSPGIVLHYLTRVFPFVEGCIELHGKQYDQPDRTFSSIQGSLKNSLTDSSDVRELIPEFFFLPEMFQNLNACNFGRKQDGQGPQVEDVILPEWTQGDVFKLVQLFREALESPYVSANLHSWIDYIHGCKQRGQEAVMSLNTFSRMTYTTDYPEDFNILETDDAGTRMAQQAQMYHFGQTPLQLFKQGEKHPPRNIMHQVLKSSLVVDGEAKLKVFKPVSQQQASLHGRVHSAAQQQQPTPGVISNEAILKVRFVSDEKIVGATKEGYAQQFIWMLRPNDVPQTTPFLLGGERKSKFYDKSRESGIDQVDRSVRRFDFPILILNEGKTVAKGGYWGGKIKFCPIDAHASSSTHQPPFDLKGHQTTVCAMACDSRELVLITGSKSGEVLVWKNVNFDNSWEALNSSHLSAGKSCSQQVGSANPWALFKELNDHERQISSVFISEPMCMFATSSHDGTVNLYNLYQATLQRTFKHPNLAPIYSVVIAQSPLAIVAFFSREDHLWNAYSINGKHITDLKKLAANELPAAQKVLTEECSHVVSPLVIKDSIFMDKLVYGTEKGHIMLRTLPSLVRFRRLLASNNHPVLTISASPDRRFLHVGCGDGGIIVITEHQAAQPKPAAPTAQSTIQAPVPVRQIQTAPDIGASSQRTVHQPASVASSQSSAATTGIFSSITSLVSRSTNQRPQNKK